MADILHLKQNGSWVSVPAIKGTDAGFGTPTASVDANVGTPSVTITASGPDTAKVFDFAFHNLKGADGSTDWDNINNKPETFPPSTHNHDDRYYTESEVDTALSGKAAATHTHDDRYYTETETNIFLEGKQDSLPEVTNDRFLHTNEDTGELEWSEVDVSSAISEHDESTAAHGDIRTKIGTDIATHNSSSSAHSDIRTELSGKAAAVHTHDDRYYTETETNTLLEGKAASVHTHDDRYYTETEVDTALSGKENVGKITINGTEYTVVVTSTDPGVGTAGQIIIVTG